MTLLSRHSSVLHLHQSLPEVTLGPVSHPGRRSPIVPAGAEGFTLPGLGCSISCALLHLLEQKDFGDHPVLLICPVFWEEKRVSAGSHVSPTVMPPLVAKLELDGGFTSQSITRKCMLGLVKWNLNFWEWK